MFVEAGEDSGGSGVEGPAVGSLVGFELVALGLLEGGSSHVGVVVGEGIDGWVG